jgi:hypothetical protein
MISIILEAGTAKMIKFGLNLITSANSNVALGLLGNFELLKNLVFNPFLRSLTSAGFLPHIITFFLLFNKTLARPVPQAPVPSITIFSIILNL